MLFTFHCFRKSVIIYKCIFYFFCLSFDSNDKIKTTKKYVPLTFRSSSWGLGGVVLPKSFHQIRNCVKADNILYLPILYCNHFSYDEQKFVEIINSSSRSVLYSYIILHRSSNINYSICFSNWLSKLHNNYSIVMGCTVIELIYISTPSHTSAKRTGAEQRLH